MKTKPRRLLAVALGLATIVALPFCWKEKAPPNAGGARSRAPKSMAEVILESFQLVEQTEDRFSLRSTFKSGERDLQLETIAGIDAESARTLVEDGIMGIHALHAQALAAYPENVSSQIAAAGKFRPLFFRKEVNGAPFSYFLLYANDRLAYGVSNKEDIKRRSLLGWIYCERHQTLYKIRLFAPLQTPPQELEAFFLALPCPP